MGLWSWVQGAFHAFASFVEDMGVDHSGADVFVAQEFLDRSYIIAGFQQMGGKTMPEGMAGATFGDAGAFDGGGDCAADGGFMGVVAAFWPERGSKESPAEGKTYCQRQSMEAPASFRSRALGR